MQITDTRLMRAGSTFLLVIGILSLLGITIFFFSSTSRSRIRMATLYDQRETARFYLESYSSELVFQLRQNANNENSTLFELFRRALNGSAGQQIDPGFHEKSGFLQTIEAGLPPNHQIIRPVISFSQPRPLPLPAMFDVADFETAEYESTLQVVCALVLEGRKFELKVQYPFRVVATLLPMVREFVFFADQLHLEQRSAFPPDDKINIVKIKGSTAGQSGSGWPLVIGPSIDGGDADRHGKILLGSGDEPIILNLAGERHFRGIRPDGSFDGGLMGDLWQVSSSYLGPINPSSAPFANQAVFQKRDGSWFSLRSIYVATDITSVVKIGVLGFSDENTDGSEGHFVNVVDRLKFHAMLAGDPSFERLRGNDEVFSQAAAIKLFGLNREIELNPSQRYRGPNRQIFGNVFGRFFQIAFFSTSRDTSPAGSGILSYGTSSPISYFTPLAGTEYSQYMTKVISSGLDYSAETAASADYYPINRDEDHNTAVLLAEDYKGTDNLSLSGRFSDYSAQWLKLNSSVSDRMSDADTSIWGRVNREFASQEEFKKFAGYDDNRFWINGVVYVKGDLDLSQGISTDNIQGGIVLVDGNITLGDVGRGIDFNILAQVNNAIDSLPADKIITFVSTLPGGQIRINGQFYLGVQLVNLQPDLQSATQQIIFSPGVENRQFFGSMVMSTPSFDNWIRNFSNDSVYLHFIPSMATEKPPVAVQISLNPAFYSLYAAD